MEIGDATVTMSQLGALGALFLTGIGFLFGVARWLMARQDRRDDGINRQMELQDNKIRRAHERLDEIPSVYIQRQEVMDHLSRIEKGQSEMRGEFNQRMDRLIQMVSDKPK